MYHTNNVEFPLYICLYSGMLKAFTGKLNRDQARDILDVLLMCSLFQRIKDISFSRNMHYLNYRYFSKKKHDKLKHTPKIL